MNLDDLTLFSQLDPDHILTHIDNLPTQIENAWALGQTLPSPDLENINHILFCGMGDSAIGGSLVASLVAGECKVPFTVLRDYDLPAWADSKTLVIAASHSGNTEETVSCFNQALERKTKLMAITTGGEIAEKCKNANGTLWQFDHKATPRTAIGYAATLPLALLSRARLIADKSADVASAVNAMREQQKKLNAESPVIHNPAKRMAGQFMDRFPLIFGSGIMAAVARRWKAQVSQNAKAWAQFEDIPEMDHNTLAGISNPQSLISKCMALFLESDFDHPRNKLRSQTTRLLMMTAGFNTDVIRGVGDTPLAQALTALHYGDYVSYYLAMAYNTSITPSESITELHQTLANS